MNLLDDAIKLAKQIAQSDFSVPVTVEFQGLTFDTHALATRRFVEYDQDGYEINATRIHIDFPEEALKENGVITRNSEGLVDLSGMLATYTDATNTSRKYIVTQTRVSETLGLIVCILQRHGDN